MLVRYFGVKELKIGDILKLVVSEEQDSVFLRKRLKIRQFWVIKPKIVINHVVNKLCHENDDV